MGWGLMINNVYLSRVTKNDLNDVIDECKTSIEQYKERLMILAASNPRTVDEMDWTDYIQREVREIMEDLYEQHTKLLLATIARDNPEDVSEG